MKNEMKWIDNGIGPEGAQTLSETLKINTSMTSLNLEGNENENEMKEEIEEKNRND